MRRLHRFGADRYLHGLGCRLVPDLHHAGLLPGCRRHGADPGQARRRDRPQKDAAECHGPLHGRPGAHRHLPAEHPAAARVPLHGRYRRCRHRPGRHVLHHDGVPAREDGPGLHGLHGSCLRHGHLWTHRRRHHHEGHWNGQCMAHRHVGLRRAVRDHVPDLLCKGQG